jgi:hypothetical protein
LCANRKVPKREIVVQLIVEGEMMKDLEGDML